MNKLFVNNFGDMAEPQRASFFRFLSVGIGEELDRLENPFVTRIRIPKSRKKIPVLVYLYINEIKVQGPNFDIETCLYKSFSYTIQIYIPAEYSYPIPIAKNSKTSSKTPSFLASKFQRKQRIKQTRIKQDIFFGEIPLMTDEGTFIINGCERVVISQIIRSPGIYFRKEFGSSVKKTKYNATIISNKGLWTTFVFDTIDPEGEIEQERIYIKLQEFKRDLGLSKEQKVQRKISDGSDDNRLYIYDILKYFGLTIQEVADSLKYPSFLFSHRLAGATFDRKELEFPYTRDEEDTLALVYRYFSAQRSGAFSIGELGRYRINLKLGLNLPKHVTYLTAHDFLGIINGLIELKYYDRMNDDIDDIKHKLVRSIGELLQNQIRVGVSRLQKNLAQIAVQDKAATSKEKRFDLEELELDWESGENWILDPRPLTISVRDFFKTSQLSQYMDQINPLAELTHKRRISVFGPNGLKRDHISTVIRDIHPSQYNRLCPIETPEGQNAGLINALAIFGRISALGALETPYFVMNQGEIYSTKQPVFLDPDQEITTPVSFSDLSFNQLKKIDKDYISIKENHLFSLKKIQDVNFLTISPLQIVSVATALIPFLEHDDANRALMGSNMQRQAVPLLYPQKPLVGTGLESVAILDSGMVIKSYCQGRVCHASSSLIEIKDKSNQVISYKLRKYYPSNQDTAINQRPLVWSGEYVFSGQIIADGPSTNDGELSLGRNLIIAYMPWEGYNYEDAIVINERVITENSLTSVHLEEYETMIPYSAIDLEKEAKYSGKVSPTIGGKFKRRKKNEEKKTKKKQENVAKEVTDKKEITKEKEKEKNIAEEIIDKKEKTKEKKKKKNITEEITDKKEKTKEKKKKKNISETDSGEQESEENLKNGKDSVKTSKVESSEPVERVTRNVPDVTKYIRRHLGKNGIVRLGSYVKENDILIGRSELCKNPPSPERRLLNAILKRKDEKVYRDISLRVSPGSEGRVVDIRLISNLLTDREDITTYMSGYIVRIYIAQIRKLQVGDKLAGRHGNKGIISRILARQDMPYLPDGTPIDIVFNPLGVPSRMNVGQIFECLLGLAGEKLGNRFKVFPFDEVYGPEASRVLVNQKLKEASLKVNCPWLFHPSYPGKVLLRDGRTGEYFDNPITVGRSYILKLIHLVEDKIHARATGPYTMITEQPLAGKSQKGGQRFGEMEVWALEAYGCSNTLQELFTIKSDDINGRNDMYEAIVVRKEMEKPSPSLSESFLTLVRELHALGLDFSFHKIEGGFSSSPSTSSTQALKDQEKDIFESLEKRLQLRALIAQNKVEQYARSGEWDEKYEQSIRAKKKEKKRILEKLLKDKKIFE